MDRCINLLPAPFVNDGADPTAIVFKTMADPFVGKLSFLRVIEGTFNAADGLYNMNSEQEEKIANFIIPCDKQTLQPQMQVIS